MVGLDGVPFGLLEELSNQGVMPNTKEIISSGIFRKMQSSVPEVSSVAWSSIITGKNPGEHGIFGFTDLTSNSYQLRFPNFNDLQSEPFWNVLNGKSVIVNVPSTYPVKDMNGVHISGFVSIDLSKSVFPKSLIPTLKEFDYRLDVDSTLAHQSMDLFLSDLEKTLHASIQTYRYLWANFEWQIFMYVFTGTDRLMHFLWDAYENRDHRYHFKFLAHFQKIDEVIGEIFLRVNEKDHFVILSDHGFEKLTHEIYINSYLKKEGFLNFENDKELELFNISPKTKAFALDPARIYLNVKGKYPRGTIELRDKGKILRDLEDLFLSLEIDGRKVMRSIYRGEEIYSGPLFDKGPDMVLVGSPGFDLKGSTKTEKLIDKRIFSGKHTQDDAFLLIYGNREKINIPDYPKVCDIAPLLIAFTN
jgi:predicted AlkP superfamily phosphohydrolase/phosphomutase